MFRPTLPMWRYVHLWVRPLLLCSYPYTTIRMHLFFWDQPWPVNFPTHSQFSCRRNGLDFLEHKGHWCSEVCYGLVLVFFSVVSRYAHSQKCLVMCVSCHEPAVTQLVSARHPAYQGSALATRWCTGHVETDMCEQTPRRPVQVAHWQI